MTTMNSMKRQKYMTLKDELPWLLGANMLLEKKENRKNEETEPKGKKCPVVDVT